mmetsp:Transcript_58109/g.131672  ORF Transcript_58109/g.131672 Transcript_58109/m.131672 type:complete len:237 (-) Transcript_58109:155-865(-)|eukprot:CAMPEP_0172602148 /NCGR_PEP_ID=MMETSP1068-20121228/22364_1 /TAXON_ID=35684 /ORGANISM="Pseudopedinella elastica, Strain CCMP716" /LENGTH=236 /DNA_ID=CAMNT_0013403427 /DNA_START=96 /DNA_END=806 /DNA_ORIENTATION=+
MLRTVLSTLLLATHAWAADTNQKEWIRRHRGPDGTIHPGKPQPEGTKSCPKNHPCTQEDDFLGITMDSPEKRVAAYSMFSIFMMAIGGALFIAVSIYLRRYCHFYHKLGDDGGHVDHAGDEEEDGVYGFGGGGGDPPAWRRKPVNLEDELLKLETRLYNDGLVDEIVSGPLPGNADYGENPFAAAEPSGGGFHGGGFPAMLTPPPGHRSSTVRKPNLPPRPTAAPPARLTTRNRES